MLVRVVVTKLLILSQMVRTTYVEFAFGKTTLFNWNIQTTKAELIPCRYDKRNKIF